MNNGSPHLMYPHQHLALRISSRPGPLEANGRGGVAQLSSPTLLPGKLNLIEADAATKRPATVLTACSIIPSIVACVQTRVYPKGPKTMNQ